MKILRKILFPIVPIYYSITWLRNVFYDKGVFKSQSYNFPIICVGNLSVGGTGKTPMIEFLIRLLKEDYKVAVLSRGYKRSTNGFKMANKLSTAKTIGDEPFQIYKKFKDTIVAVDADRQHGIMQLQELKNPDVILLDDAFQHRKVKAGFNILLTPYDRLYIDDITLPTGDLREPKSGAKRADIIIVTKCDSDISLEERNNIKKRLKPKVYQEVFFSTIRYSKQIISSENKAELSELKSADFTLVTGIANATPLVKFLKDEAYTFKHLNFKDHHVFTEAEIEDLKTKQLIVTTEKDFTRLSGKIDKSKLFYLPIETRIFESEKFNNLILNYITNKN